MQKSDRKRFANVLLACAEMYGKRLSDSLVDLYWQGLADVEITAVEDAIARHMSNPDSGQFMPKLADIRRMLGGTTQDAALRSWAKVDRAVRQIGTYQTVVFDDALIHCTIADMGGWIKLGEKNEDEWPFVAREFEHRYRGYCTRPPESYPPKLLGIADAHNATNGYRTSDPVLIGDADKAQRVLLGGSDVPQIGFRGLDAVGALRLAVLGDDGERTA